MFNIFKRSQTSEAPKQKNLEYGRHIDIRPTGYIQPENFWAEPKPLTDNENLEKGWHFGQNKQPFLNATKSNEKTVQMFPSNERTKTEKEF